MTKLNPSSRHATARRQRPILESKPPPLPLRPLSRPARLLASAAAASLLAAATSCSTTHYRNSADRETAGILKDKGALVPNMEPDFSIEPPEPVSLAKLPKSSKSHDFLGDAAPLEKGATVLTLADALETAVRYNRDYLSRKETLYREALDLTLVRHEFTPLPLAGGSAVVGDLHRDVRRGLDALVRETTFTQRADAGVDWLLKTGARITSDLSIDFLKFINGDMRSVNRSRFAATLSQPLLRGAGSLAVTENLTQAEHDLLYSIRDFARFREEFTVRIATRYYQILRARDAVRNNWLALQGFKLSVMRENALTEEGRRTQTDLGRLQQASLRSELTWINALQNYLDQLDLFKIELGLPVDSRIALDDRELKKLTIIPPELTREEAATVAVHTRLDLKNSRERTEDTARRIKVFAQDFLPGLDVVSGVIVSSDPDNRVIGLDSRLSNWSAGLALDLDPDKKQERNSYRAALIAHERSTRDLEFDIDQVKLQIYNSARDLEQARRQYNISLLGTKLAQNRLEAQQLLMELNRGTAKDLVDAQNDLVASQNDLTGALVNHTIARLNYWRDMGILYINKDGTWIRKLNEEES